MRACLFRRAPPHGHGPFSCQDSFESATPPWQASTPSRVEIGQPIQPSVPTVAILSEFDVLSAMAAYWLAVMVQNRHSPVASRTASPHSRSVLQSTSWARCRLVCFRRRPPLIRINFWYRAGLGETAPSSLKADFRNTLTKRSPTALNRCRENRRPTDFLHLALPSHGVREGDVVTVHVV